MSTVAATRLSQLRKSASLSSHVKPDPHTSLSSPANGVLTLASSAISSPRVSIGSTRPQFKSKKTTPLIVKKKTISAPSVSSSTTPLFSAERRSKRYQKSESEEELLNIIKESDVVLPLPAPDPSVRHESPAPRLVTPDRQRISDLEGRLKRLTSKYRKLESSYRILLVRSTGRESALSGDLDHTRDSVQYSLTPRRQTEEPIVEVLHVLTELKAKVDRMESLTSTMWTMLAGKSNVA